MKAKPETSSCCTIASILAMSRLYSPRDTARHASRLGNATPRNAAFKSLNDINIGWPGAAGGTTPSHAANNSNARCPAGTEMKRSSSTRVLTNTGTGSRNIRAILKRSRRISRMEIKRAQIWNRERVWLHTANLAQTPRCALHNEDFFHSNSNSLSTDTAAQSKKERLACCNNRKKSRDTLD